MAQGQHYHQGTCEYCDRPTDCLLAISTTDGETIELCGACRHDDNTPEGRENIRRRLNTIDLGFGHLDHDPEIP